MDLDHPDIAMVDSDDDRDMDDAYSTRDGFEESQTQELPSRTFSPADSTEEQDSPEIDMRRKSASLPSEIQLQDIQEGAGTCSSYDIVPYLAAPHSTSVNAIAVTSFIKWIFTGGQDGYIRRFDFYSSMLGRSLLTVAQRHPYVDSVTKVLIRNVSETYLKAGVLLSYWENEEPPEESSTPAPSYQVSSPRLSPVYCLAVHSQAVWILSGLESGGINLQSVRHEEGKIVATLRGHGGPVSVLSLASDEKSVLSGGWDRVVNEWDLDIGQTIRSYNGHIGQISSIHRRPVTTPPLTGDQLDGKDRQDKESPESYDPLFDDTDDENENISRETQESQPDSQAAIPPPNERDIFLVSGIDGTLLIWDPRKSDPVHRFPVPAGTPPWRAGQLTDNLSLQDGVIKPVCTH
ncbi:Transcription factor spt8 [Neolecta irregularis DAH-3]|uniref:Transcription factor spt8 n=1 Tax=Neolecta irregularis (strain DAH-3) TaxID=1198029 RepID=A0A1U7LSL5_NEOID|nr:Transcription factor spt8 [Neolecta irregularis DAH-3]|eukprot:OLL25619.1 Transcription factor spt8 [Neolecta irregularis DAH-3]